MAYIGKEPAVGNFQVCDAISVVNGQAAYTLQVDSSSVVPESANHMLVSLNGILQKPGSSFTVSGSTITFASNLATGDVIDFVMLLGNVLDIGVPSDSTVTNAKTNFTSTSSAAGLQIKGDGTTDGTLQLNCSQNSHGIKLASPAHSAGQSYKLIFPSGNVTADRFLKVDSVSGSGTTGIGTLTFAEAGGTVELLHSGTLSSAVTNIDNVFSSSHRLYKVFVDKAYGSNDAEFQFNFRSGGASGTIQNAANYRATGIRQERHSSGGVGMAIANTYWGQTYGRFGQTMESGNASFSMQLDMTIWNPIDTSPTHFRAISSSYDDGATYIVGYDNSGVYQDNASITGIALNCSSGTWSSGTVRIYGYKAS